LRLSGWPDFFENGIEGMLITAEPADCDYPVGLISLKMVFKEC
jgi:hypothetical protein